MSAPTKRFSIVYCSPGSPYPPTTHHCYSPETFASALARIHELGGLEVVETREETIEDVWAGLKKAGSAPGVAPISGATIPMRPARVPLTPRASQLSLGLLL